jgi:hypothetical protein
MQSSRVKSLLSAKKSRVYWLLLVSGKHFEGRAKNQGGFPMMEVSPFLANFALLNYKIRPVSKGTNFTGQPVFNQLLKLITRQQIEQLSKNIRGSEEYIKELNGYSHPVIMLFAIFNRSDFFKRELDCFTSVGLKIFP